MLNDVVNFFEELGLGALFVASLVKVLTSITVAFMAKNFNWSEFGEVFRKDFLRLLVVSGFVVLYENDAITATMVAGYMTYLGARILENVGVIFPEFGNLLPQTFNVSRAKTATPIATTEPTSNVDG